MFFQNTSHQASSFTALCSKGNNVSFSYSRTRTVLSSLQQAQALSCRRTLQALAVSSVMFSHHCLPASWQMQISTFEFHATMLYFSIHAEFCWMKCRFIFYFQMNDLFVIKSYRQCWSTTQAQIYTHYLYLGMLAKILLSSTVKLLPSSIAEPNQDVWRASLLTRSAWVPGEPASPCHGKVVVIATTHYYRVKNKWRGQFGIRTTSQSNCCVFMNNLYKELNRLDFGPNPLQRKWTFFKILIKVKGRLVLTWAEIVSYLHGNPWETHVFN